MGSITDVVLRNLIKADKPVNGMSDGGGLYFTLSISGTAAWIFRYRFGGKQKEYTIGRYPDIPLTEARRLSIGLRNKVNDGIDVALEKRLAKQQQSSIETLNDMADEYLSNQTHLKHPKVPRQRYDKHVRPAIGNIPLDRITPQQIYDLLKTVKFGKPGITTPAPTVANDVLRFLKSVLNLAVSLRKIPFNPAAELAGKDAGGQEKPRQRALELDELTKLFTAINNTENLGRENELAIKLLLVLCVRKNELLRAQWNEFSLESKLWTIPKERSKTSAPFRVPLPELAVEWLKELKVHAGRSDYVFPARRIQKRKLPHVSPDTLNVALSRVKHNLEHFVVHDLRRTARTHLGRLGVSFEVAELCLNHKLGGVQGIYNTHDYFPARQEALEMWAKVIAKIDQGNVISISKTKKPQKAVLG